MVSPLCTSRLRLNQDSNVHLKFFESNEHLIQICNELISNKNETLKEHISKLSDNFTKLITIILQCKQNSFFIILF